MASVSEATSTYEFKKELIQVRAENVRKCSEAGYKVGEPLSLVDFIILHVRRYHA